MFLVLFDCEVEAFQKAWQKINDVAAISSSVSTLKTTFSPLYADYTTRKKELFDMDKRIANMEAELLFLKSACQFKAFIFKICLSV